MPSARKKPELFNTAQSKWDLRPYKNGTLLHIRVHPNAHRNRIGNPIDGVIQLKLNAAPIKGTANKSCIQYLSSFFHLAKSRIEIIRGLRSREKWVWIKQVDPKVLIEILTLKILPEKRWINSDEMEMMKL